MNEPNDLEELLGRIDGPRPLPEPSRRTMLDRALGAYDDSVAALDAGTAHSSESQDLKLADVIGSDNSRSWSVFDDERTSSQRHGGSRTSHVVGSGRVLLARVAAALLVVGTLGALVIVQLQSDANEPAVEAVPLATGLGIGPGVYVADDFRTPFSFTTASDWEVQRAAQTSIRIADPSSTRDDVRTVSFWWLDEPESSIGGLEALFENPPNGVSVRPLEPVTVSGRAGIRTTLVVSEDAPCRPVINEYVGCIAFPFTGDEVAQLSRSRVYEIVATVHPASGDEPSASQAAVVLMMAATTTQGESEDPWLADGLAVLDSIIFTDRDG